MDFKISNILFFRKVIEKLISWRLHKFVDSIKILTITHFASEKADVILLLTHDLQSPLEKLAESQIVSLFIYFFDGGQEGMHLRTVCEDRRRHYNTD